jgi:hypothetical protein
MMPVTDRISGHSYTSLVGVDGTRCGSANYLEEITTAFEGRAIGGWWAIETDALE